MQKADHDPHVDEPKTADATVPPRLLLVDDEEMLLEFYEAVLSAEYEVLVAGDIGTAQRLLKQYQIDALACDFHFASSSGLDLLAWIDTNHPGLLSRTMILSGDPDPDLGGFNVRVICKPISADNLTQSFARLLSRNTGERS